MKYLLCIVIFAVSLSNVRTITPEEATGIHEAVLPFIVDCGKEIGVEEDALKEAKEKGSTEGIDNCFFACVMKKAELIDDKGLFDSEKAVEKLKEHLSKEEDIKMGTEIITKCSAVNDEDVNDGEAGCDRAKLLVGCFMEHKSMIFGN